MFTRSVFERRVHSCCPVINADVYSRGRRLLLLSLHISPFGRPGKHFTAGRPEQMPCSSTFLLSHVSVRVYVRVYVRVCVCTCMYVCIFQVLVLRNSPSIQLLAPQRWASSPLP